MRLPFHNRITCAFLLALVLVAGCDKSSTPPKSITVDELRPALEKAFAKAKPETKDLVVQVGEALKRQEYSKAYFGLQTLGKTSGLNKEQGMILTRGMLCMNTVLQSAQAQGDQQAAQVLRWQRTNK